MQETLFDTYENQLWTSLGRVRNADGMKFRALNAYKELGIPSQKAEDWRYADLSDLRAKSYNAAQYADIDQVKGFCEKTTATIVFVNGAFCEKHSTFNDTEDLITFRHLSNHFTSMPERVDELMIGKDAITNLNTALMTAGMVINVKAGAKIDHPVEIIHVMDKAQDSASHIRHIVEMGENSSATIVERFIGDDTAYWANNVMQIRIPEQAHLTHIKLQEEGAAATHISKVFADIGDKAHYGSLTLQLGAKSGRVESHVRILGEGANVWVDGATLAGTGQTLDTFNHVSHIVPNATSDQIFRAVLDKKSKTAFQGKVSVATDAQLTQADQSCRSLLLDRTAEANAKPELEIFADDVKCSHGATVGELDQKAYFYLLARGINPFDARRILVEAFAADSLVHIADDTLRDQLNERLLHWMATRHEAQGQ